MSDTAQARNVDSAEHAAGEPQVQVSEVPQPLVTIAEALGEIADDLHRLAATDAQSTAGYLVNSAATTMHNAARSLAEGTGDGQVAAQVVAAMTWCGMSTAQPTESGDIASTETSVDVNNTTSAAAVNTVDVREAVDVDLHKETSPEIASHDNAEVAAVDTATESGDTSHYAAEVVFEPLTAPDAVESQTPESETVEPETDEAGTNDGVVVDDKSGVNEPDEPGAASTTIGASAKIAAAGAAAAAAGALVAASTDHDDDEHVALAHQQVDSSDSAAPASAAAQTLAADTTVDHTSSDLTSAHTPAVSAAGDSPDSSISAQSSSSDDSADRIAAVTNSHTLVREHISDDESGMVIDAADEADATELRAYEEAFGPATESGFADDSGAQAGALAATLERGAHVAPDSYVADGSASVSSTADADADSYPATVAGIQAPSPDLDVTGNAGLSTPMQHTATAVELSTDSGSDSVESTSVYADATGDQSVSEQAASAQTGGAQTGGAQDTSAEQASAEAEQASVEPVADQTSTAAATATAAAVAQSATAGDQPRIESHALASETHPVSETSADVEVQSDAQAHHVGDSGQSLVVDQQVTQQQADQAAEADSSWLRDTIDVQALAKAEPGNQQAAEAAAAGYTEIGSQAAHMAAPSGEPVAQSFALPPREVQFARTSGDDQTTTELGHSTDHIDLDGQVQDSTQLPGTTQPDVPVTASQKVFEAASASNVQQGLADDEDTPTIEHQTPDSYDHLAPTYDQVAPTYDQASTYEQGRTTQVTQNPGADTVFGDSRTTRIMTPPEAASVDFDNLDDSAATPVPGLGQATIPMHSIPGRHQADDSWQHQQTRPMTRPSEDATRVMTPPSDDTRPMTPPTDDATRVMTPPTPDATRQLHDGPYAATVQSAVPESTWMNSDTIDHKSFQAQVAQQAMGDDTPTMAIQTNYQPAVSTPQQGHEEPYEEDRPTTVTPPAVVEQLKQARKAAEAEGAKRRRGNLPWGGAPGQ